MNNPPLFSATFKFPQVSILLMILTRKEIQKEISKKRIRIEPLDKSAIGPASVDLTLGNKLRVFRKGKAIQIRENTNYKGITALININKGYLLKPGELVLGITREKITLPDNICGWLQSRSRFARFGLMSHLSAPFVCPGVANKQVLEIYNAGPRKLKLMPGLRICQIIFQCCKGKAKYKGIFKSQEL